MNPEEKNPVSGVGSAAGAAPVDFTGVGGDQKLSMADSLASAEDNLTSAGMAAPNNASDAIGLDQIGAADPSAMMARPDEPPLVPAAPVPGSIGSAMSGPAVGASEAPSVVPTTNPAAVAAPTTSASASTGLASNSAGTMPSAPAMVMGAGASATSTPAASVAGGADANMAGGSGGAMPMTSGMSSSSASAMPYNPFAMSEPAPVQTKVEKAAPTHEAKKKMSLLTIVLAGLAVIFAVAAVIFAVLWQQAAGKERIVYVAQPVEDQTGAAKGEDAVLVCSKTVGVDEVGDMGMAGFVSMTETDRMEFVAGVLNDVYTTQRYMFTDVMAAQSMSPLFDQMVVALPGTVNYTVNDVNVDLSMTLTGAQLDGWSMNQEVDAATNVTELTADQVQASFEGQGFACSLE